MSDLPKDPYMLLSYINTQLRDNYPSLEEMAGALDFDIDELLAKMDSSGFVFDKKVNKFISK